MRAIFLYPGTVIAKNERFSAVVDLFDRVVVIVHMLLDKENGISKQLFRNRWIEIFDRNDAFFTKLRSAV